MTGDPLDPGLLLHLTTLPPWLDALRAGRYEAPSLASQGFIHLSRPAQVALPAAALFGAEADVWLLVLDPRRLHAPVRWEPADPPGRTPMDFPHLYGPLNLDAVIAVVPYPRAADGTFDPPVSLPGSGDLAARSLAMEWYLARSRAAQRTELRTGVSVRHPEFAVSYEHNRVILDRALDADAAHDLCALQLAGLEHWQVCIDAPVDEATLEGFRAAGWSHVENLLMVAVPRLAQPSVDVAVREVPGAHLIDARTASWRRDIPGVSDETIRQLVERERLSEQVTDLRHLVVRAGPEIVAQADLYLLGATAQIDWVETEPAHRGRGFASALVLTAVETAAAHGCDLVFLRADAADWPWRLYERLGFRTVGSAHVFDRDLS